MPINLTDMRSYWELVNQVSSYYYVKPHLQAFRELLKKKIPWYWDGVLQRLFEESREHISKEVLNGIELFVKTRWTGLCTDWSKMGVRYFMSQNYCSWKELRHVTCWRKYWVPRTFSYAPHRPLLGIVEHHGEVLPLLLCVPLT
jgi:hypothetical protein